MSSRIGQQIIIIPNQVTVSLNDSTLTVTGPKGTLVREFKIDLVAINISGSEITLTPLVKNVFTNSLWGTYASHVKNMILGVTEGYTKKLIIEGVGFKAALKGEVLELDIGFSHLVPVNIPVGVSVVVEKNIITITGYDKEKVGEFAARVRSHKKTEPYKGKGIRYENELVKRKQGKKTVS